MVERILTFDANKDGSLAKAELTDERLHALFDRADSDSNGIATKIELTALFTKENAALAASGRRGGPMGGTGAPGGPRGDRGPEGAGERGPNGGPPPREPGGQGGEFRGQRPRPGQVLPPGLQDRLSLTDDQRRRVDALQEIVDTQLEKILTPEQKQMLNDPGPPSGAPGRGGDGPPRGAGGPSRTRPIPLYGDRPNRPANEP